MCSFSFPLVFTSILLVTGLISREKNCRINNPLSVLEPSALIPQEGGFSPSGDSLIQQGAFHLEERCESPYELVELLPT